MLRKRTRSHQKDQAMSVSGSESYFQSDRHNNHKNNSFFSIHGLFVGLGSKGVADCDSIRSPTSPLDFRVFSNLGNPFIRSSRSPHNGHQKSWDCSKVGLSIVDSLDNDKKQTGKVLRSSDSRNILFGPGLRIKTPKHQTHFDSFQAPKSLPKNYAVFPQTQIKSPLQKGNPNVVFEIGEDPVEPEPFGKIRSCSLDSYRSFSALSGLADRKAPSSFGNICSKNVTSQVGSPSSLQLIGGSPNSYNFLNVKVDPVSVSGSGNGFSESLPASEIELSEDYTCVISHGANPKTTHIYGDCILECHGNHLRNLGKNEEKELRLAPAITSLAVVYPSDNFLSFCYSCNKKLEGKDIYIYRGEKAFCSLNCRSQEILFDEEMEEAINKSAENSPKSGNCQELFETGIIIST